jgi:hypothetical protein
VVGSFYIGKAGHLAFMGELCLRGYNVAMPEIDKGDDIFIVNDATRCDVEVAGEDFDWRQTKEISSIPFRLSENQILTAQSPELHYAFVMRKSRLAFPYS